MKEIYKFVNIYTISKCLIIVLNNGSKATKKNRGIPLKYKTILLANNAQLMTEWNYEKNTDVDPHTLSEGSGKKVWWKCSKGHEWEASAHNRRYGRGCPYCSNNFVLIGFNDLGTTNPELAKEWHPTKNKEITPMNVVAGSEKKVWWKCSKGHEWETTIASRNSGCKCPYCANKKILEGFNDLETTNPELAKEWHPTKNISIKLNEISAGSGKKIWWKCSKGHEWEATVVSRSSKSLGCPVCSNQKLLVGYNDLGTTNPELAKEWHPTKNGDLTPSDIINGSGKKIWWQCDKGHEWMATANSRVRGNGCARCSSEMRTSFPEQVIYYYFNLIKPTENRAIVYGKEIDVYIASWKIGIEYDGLVYHNTNKSREKEINKNNYLLKHGITIIRVKESIENKVDYENMTIYCKYNTNYQYLDYVLNELSIIVSGLINPNIKINANIEKDRPFILEQYVSMTKRNSLLEKYSEIASSWNKKKNGLLTPDKVSYSSDKKVWWTCNNGHEWISTISNRIMGNKCPYCSNKKVLSGYNDLATTNAALAKEWHPFKNNKLSPNDVTSGSKKKVWWICCEGHEWISTVDNRNRGRGCPICRREKSKKNNQVN